MSDGKVTISVLSDDRAVDELMRKLQNLNKLLNTGGSGGGNGVDGIGDGIERANESTKRFTTSLLLAKAAAKAIDIAMGAIGSAIGRFDTMRQYPKVMEKMGYSTAQSERSIRKLANGIEGLPTTLQEVVSTTQQLAGMTGDLNKATDTTLALNNAFLASGSGAADASRGLVQYTQMLSNGKVDMMSWRTLQETMNVGLIKVANSFGYAGSRAKLDLYDALKKGEITFDQLNDKIIELNQGVGGFADMALTGSEGIATSWTNIKTAVTKGVTTVIESIDRMVENVTGKNLAKNLNDLKFVVGDIFKFIGNAIEMSAPLIEGVIKTIGVIIGVAKELDFVLIALGITIVSFKAYNDVFKPFVTTLGSVFDAAKASGNIVKELGEAYGKGTGKLSLLTTAYGLFTKQLTLAEAKQVLLTKATTLFKTITSPVTLGIGAVAGALFFLYKKATEVRPEIKQLEQDMENLKKENQKFKDGLIEGSEVHATNKQAIKDTSEQMRVLAQETMDLAAIENKSAADKKLLKMNIDELNQSVEGMNLAYDESTETLNLSAQAMAKYIEAAEGQKEIAEQQRYIAELTGKQKVAEGQLAEARRLNQAAVQALSNEENLSVAEREKMLEQWKTSSANIEWYIQHLNALGIAIADEKEGEKAAIEKVAKAEQDAARIIAEAYNNRVLSMEMLDETQKKVVENMQGHYNKMVDAAQNAFEQIDTKSDISVAKMIENLEHNRKAMADWADNMALLASKGVDEGLLNKLREMGPTSAGLVANMAKASDSELDKLSESFRLAGTESTDNFKKGFDVKDVPDAVMDLVTQAKTTLQDGIKSANFESLGQAVPDGVTQGMQKGKGKTTAEAEQMAKGVRDKFANSLSIASPSGVFRGFGINITEGLVQGIEMTKSFASLSASNMANDIKDRVEKTLQTMNVGTGTAFDGFTRTISDKLRVAVQSFRDRMGEMQDDSRRLTQGIVTNLSSASSQAYTAGYNMGIGFRNGLRSTQSAILSTARGIADQAATRIKNALRIQSPSKVTTELGRYTGEGLAIGMEDRIPQIKQAALKLSDSALPKIDIQRTFSSVGMGSTSTSTVNNTDNRDNSSKSVNVTFTGDIQWSGKEDIERTMQEIGWLAGQDKWRLEGAGGGLF